MAVTLSANYSKKLGLPAYSSHSFSASVEIELTDLSQVETECQKLYALLQQSVDREIQQVGFVPPPMYGMNDASNGNGHASGHHVRSRPNGNGQNMSNTHAANGQHRAGNGNGPADRWNCTEGQRGFILRILNENQFDKQETENLALQLFGAGVRELNKMQASQLIDELLAKAGKPRQTTRWRSPQPNGHEHAH